MKEINNHLVVDLSKEWRSLFWKKKQKIYQELTAGQLCEHAFNERESTDMKEKR